MFDTLFSPIILQAFFIGGMASVSFGLIGSFIVVRRIGYLAGAIAHCAFGGIGIGIGLQYVVTLSGFSVFKFLAPDPMIAAMIVAIISALSIGMIRLVSKEREDTVIGMIWALGMALGLFLLETVPSNRNISDYLLGTIIFNTQQDAINVTILSGMILVIVLLLFKRFEAVCFDEEFMRLRGINATFYFQLLLVLTAITVVILVQIVGIVLVIAMLTIPAATACRFAQRLSGICFFAVVFGFASNWLGLLASVCLNFPPGPTIVLIASAIYFVALIATPKNA
ncbi:MAG: metal ABC transporter permease [Planctomycetaceae bacterium]|jgi:zinc transport system permease protein|nr:metal ABC transporter permease [Planctomycetaceae bacterium]